jgi:hypothetical protein
VPLYVFGPPKHTSAYVASAYSIRQHTHVVPLYVFGAAVWFVYLHAFTRAFAVDVCVCCRVDLCMLVCIVCVRRALNERLYLNRALNERLYLNRALNERLYLNRAVCVE